MPESRMAAVPCPVLLTSNSGDSSTSSQQQAPAAL